MEITVKQTKIARFLRINVNVRYEEEDMPNDAPLRTGDIWAGTIDLQEHRFLHWPQGRALSFNDMKICDEGTYTLYDADGAVIVERNGYVPNQLLPGAYGDYLSLTIDETGLITNWLKSANLSDFQDEE